jgi:hypothetical protein
MECDVWSACWAWVHMPLDSLPRPSSPLEHTRSHRTTLGCPSTRSQLPLCLHASLVCQTVEPVHNRTAPGRKSGRKNGQRDLIPSSGGGLQSFARARSTCTQISGRDSYHTAAVHRILARTANPDSTMWWIGAAAMNVCTCVQGSYARVVVGGHFLLLVVVV